MGGATEEEDGATEEEDGATEEEDGVPLLPILPPPSNGLIVHNTAIKKLSGPISFYYLRPDYENFIAIPESDREKYPLIILFGDRHESFDSICNPCDISNGCYRIDSDEFLQVIDSLAIKTLSEPIQILPAIEPDL